MYQPRQPTPSNSPTPSKSSLRRASGTQNPSQRSLIPSPSPRFDDQPAAPIRFSPRSPPNQTFEYESDEDDEPLFQPEPLAPDEGDSYFPYPELERPFQPFFTLVEDALTSEHHHPAVHYIFSDDDTEIITEAALRSLEQDNIGTSSPAGNDFDQRGESGSNEAHLSRLPPANEGTREHYLVLDVQPMSQARAQQVQQQQQHQHQHQHQQQQQQQQQQQSSQGQTQLQHNSQHEYVPSFAVTSFTTFSPDWQISSASITSAPTMGDTLGADEGLMLRIEGCGLAPVSDDFDLLDKAGKAVAGRADDRDSGAPRGRDRERGLQDMIELFQSRLGAIKRLIEMDTDGVSGNAYRDVAVGATAAAGGDELEETIETKLPEGLGMHYAHELEQQD